MARTGRTPSSPSSWLIASLILLTTCLPVSAEDAGPKSKFIFPEGGEKFFFSDIVKVTWQSPIDQPDIRTWCIKTDGTTQLVAQDVAPPGQSFMLARVNYTDVKNCWFDLAKESNPMFKDASTAGRGFYVIADTRAATTVSASASTTTTPAATGSVPPGATPTGIFSSLPSASETSADRSAEPSSPGLSGGAIAGVSVAVSLTFASLAAFAVIYWHRRRNGRKLLQDAGGSGKGEEGHEKVMGEPVKVFKMKPDDERDDLPRQKFGQDGLCEMPDPREQRHHELAV